MTLSVAMMMKGEMPSRKILAMIGKFGLPRRRRMFVLFRSRKMTTKAQESTCESTVARAAPATSMRRTKMNSGSSAMFAAAPTSVVAMPVAE